LYSNGLYAWNEQDQRWTSAGPVSPLALASIKGTLVAGHNPGGLRWSDDQEATWSKGMVNAVDLSVSVLFSGSEQSFADAPVWTLGSGDELVFAGASTGIYYSEDHGRTWTRARTGLPAKSPGIAFLVEPTFILASTQVNENRGGSTDP
jgi:hypothetical protein